MIHPPDWSFPSAFVDGALADDERVLFEEHLAGCAECRNEVAALRSLKARLAEAPRRPLPAALRAAWARRSRPPLWRRWIPPARSPRWFAAGLATAALAVATAWVLQRDVAVPAAIDLEPLMAAHAASAAERPMPVSGFYEDDAVRWASYNDDADSR